MTRQIDTDAEIDSIRLKEQASNVGAVSTGYWHLLAKEGGLFHEDDNEVAAGPLGTGLVPGGRLTLTTATPVTTADVTGAATLYYTPYIHDMIELYDGERAGSRCRLLKSLSACSDTLHPSLMISGAIYLPVPRVEGTVRAGVEQAGRDADRPAARRCGPMGGCRSLTN